MVCVLDLQLEIQELIASFPREIDSPYVLVRIPTDKADEWLGKLIAGIRRCYATDEFLDARAAETGLTRREILAARLPSRGPVMAGDFGEVLTFVHGGVAEHPLVVIGPKKWRLKQDRTKPAPYSDVVQFVVPQWPTPSDEDQLICSEVKTKSTNGDSSPILEALADSEKDRVKRLAKTLVWLRDRAITEDLGTTTIAHLDRFIDATDHPEAQKRFQAVAVVCESLLRQEVTTVPDEIPAEHLLLVIAVPDLKKRYEDVYDALLDSVDDPPD